MRLALYRVLAGLLLWTAPAAAQTPSAHPRVVFAHGKAALRLPEGVPYSIQGDGTIVIRPFGDKSAELLITYNPKEVDAALLRNFIANYAKQRGLHTETVVAYKGTSGAPIVFEEPKPDSSSGVPSTLYHGIVAAGRGLATFTLEVPNDSLIRHQEFLTKREYKWILATIVPEPNRR